eukprot:SAG31_NODE_16411_length_710_cov_1.003273_1_plen_139_part_10
MGEGTDDFTGVTFGALLFHDALEQAGRDICSMQGTVTLANGVITGGIVVDLSCSITFIAPQGSTVQLKMLQNSLHRNSLLVYNSTLAEPENLLGTVTGRDDNLVISSGTSTLRVVESEKQPCERPPCADETFSFYWSFI